MFNLFDTIEEKIRAVLVNIITGNLSNVFSDIDAKIESIAGQVSKTPESWNEEVFSIIRNLHDEAVIPIAAIIITYVLCYELISMVIDKNNLHEIDSWVFFRWIFKACIAIILLTNTFTIVMAIFDVGQDLVLRATDVVSTEAAINISDTISALESSLNDSEIGWLIMMAFESLLLKFVMLIGSAIITIILYGRFIEIYLVSCCAAVPFATLMNREWGQIGNNYIKNIIALSFQGFFIMVVVGIYSVLISVKLPNDIIAGNAESAFLNVAGYTLLLCFALFKVSSLSKSIFGAH